MPAMPRKDKVELRLTTLEKADWVKAAGGSRLLSQWIRGVCNEAAESKRTSEKVVATDSAARSDTPRVAVKVGQPEPRDDSSGEKASRQAPGTECVRWMNHRPGVYCGSCKQVVK